MARPAVQLTAEQKRLLAALDKAIEKAQSAEDEVWKLAQSAREAGIPDTRIIASSGLTKSTFQRRLGSRPAEPDQSPG